MEIRFNTNIYAKPSFGMAQLTEIGENAVKDYQGELKESKQGGPYSTKNMTLEILKEATDPKDKSADEILDNFFKYGSGPFDGDNATFVEMQILPTTSYHSLKKFLKGQHEDAVKLKEGADYKAQTPLGEKVIENLVKIFDQNINNMHLSRKQCKDILSLAEPYMEPSAVAPRALVVSGKLYSK
ncbi:hypothetical protein IKA15_00245 [bacterium]|nr:hypothetical protein [bacterium]